MRYIKYARHHGEVVRIISAPEYVKYISMYVEVHDNAKDAGATVPRHTLATIDGIHFFNFHYRESILPRVIRAVKGKKFYSSAEAERTLWDEFFRLGEDDIFVGEFKRMAVTLADAMVRKSREQLLSENTLSSSTPPKPPSG